MKPRQRPPGARAGFTLLESIVSLAVFSVVGYALTLAFGAGTNAEHSVSQTAGQERLLRGTTEMLADELRASNDARITVATLADGNHSVTFMTRIQVGTTLAWGVHDRFLGSTDAQQNRANWSLRYTVVSVVSGGTTTRRLVRQVLDNALAVQRQDVVLERVRNGTANPAGFRVVKQGSMWVVTISTDGESAAEEGMRVVFHVQARNK